MSDFPADSPLVAEVVPSPNHKERVGRGRPDMIVLHYTGMATAADALERLCSLDAPQVSSHYLVYEDGRILQLVPEARRAQHAGISSWEGETDINSRSVGIEMYQQDISMFKGDKSKLDFTDWQYDTVAMLVYDICHRLKIKRSMVVGHAQINSVQRGDPKNFDWDRFNSKVDDVSRMMAIRFGPDYAVNA